MTSDSETMEQWLERHKEHTTAMDHITAPAFREWWLRCKECREAYCYRRESKKRTSLKIVASMSLAEVIAEIDDIVNLGDQCYRVRDKAAEKAHPFKGSAWDLPEVKRYDELCERIRILLREAGLRK